MRSFALLAAGVIAIAPLGASAATQTLTTTINASVKGEETCTIANRGDLAFAPYDMVSVNGPSGVDDTASGKFGVVCTGQSHYLVGAGDKGGASGSSTLVAPNSASPPVNYSYSLPSGTGPFTGTGAEQDYGINGIIPHGQDLRNFVYSDPKGITITVTPGVAV